LHWLSGSFQLQTELFLMRCKEGWAGEAVHVSADWSDGRRAVRT